MPSFIAAAWDRSTIKFSATGPRSFTRRNRERWLCRLVTFTHEPRGSVRCAHVHAVISNVSPFAVLRPLNDPPYQDAVPISYQCVFFVFVSGETVALLTALEDAGAFNKRDFGLTVSAPLGAVGEGGLATTVTVVPRATARSPARTRLLLVLLSRRIRSTRVILSFNFILLYCLTLKCLSQTFGRT